MRIANDLNDLLVSSGFDNFYVEVDKYVRGEYAMLPWQDIITPS
jgi:hypothetical protein